MRRVFSFLLTPLLLLAVAWAAPLTQEQKAATLAYVASLRNEDGGYRPAAAAGPSQLGATTGSLRAIKYFGGTLERKRRTTRFVMSCYHPTLGAFSDVPGGTPSVGSTASGLMSLAELEGPIQEHAPAILRYFNENAKAPGEVYIAAAALDAAKLTNPNAAAWISRFAPTLTTGDESNGSGVVDLAGAAITTLRLGGTVGGPEHVIRVIRASQRADGGFSTAETSDLSTTYRVMRAARMLKFKPEAARVRAFIDRCRNADGGYGRAPGQPSTASATYNAGIVLYWLDEAG